MKTRYHETHVLWNKEEIDRLRQRMDEAGVKNCSAFIRKMSLDGYIVKLDMDDIHEMIRLLRNATNNLNQIARKANTVGTVYEEDLKQIKAMQENIWNAANQILRKLGKID